MNNFYPPRIYFHIKNKESKLIEMPSVKKIIAVILTAVLLLFIFTAMFYLKIIKFNTPSSEKYPVRGVDVSSYQGQIDWQTLSGGLDFAFIKATEGSSFTDERFSYNYRQAQKTGLRIGAYHFFSFDSSGKTQAENFINTVEKYDRMLPPVVDVEFYGKYRKEKKPPEEVTNELKALLDALEEHYGKKPIIYATGSAYSLYIEENFSDYDIWIRDVYFKPSGDWTFWQYSDTARLDGYNGEEKHIDLNVFNGTKEEFERY